MRRSAAHDVCRSEGVEACLDRRRRKGAHPELPTRTPAERLRRRTVPAAQSGTSASGHLREYARRIGP